MLGIVSGLGPLIPGLVPERQFSLNGLVEQAIVGVLIASALAVITTACARGVMRLYARARTSRGTA